MTATEDSIHGQDPHSPPTSKKKRDPIIERFHQLAKRSRIGEIQTIVRENPDKKFPLAKYYQQYCRNGCIEGVKWLFPYFKNQTKQLSGLFEATRTGQYQVVEWLLQNCHVHSKEQLMLLACDTQNLPLIKLISRHYPFETKSYIYAFTRSCEHGDQESAQWLWSTYLQKTESAAIRAFHSPGNNQMLVEWLWSLVSDRATESDVYNALRYSCLEDHLEVSQWIYENCRPNGEPVDLNSKNSQLFRWCADNGNLEVAQWIYSLGGVDVRANNDEAFKICLHYEWDEFAQWLTTICPAYELVVGEHENRYRIHQWFHDSPRVGDFANRLGVQVDLGLNGEAECLICPEPEDYVGQPIFKLPCQHSLCQHCLTSWYLSVNYAADRVATEQRDSSTLACFYCRNEFKWTECSVIET